MCMQVLHFHLDASWICGDAAFCQCPGAFATTLSHQCLLIQEAKLHLASSTLQQSLEREGEGGRFLDPESKVEF